MTPEFYFPCLHCGKWRRQHLGEEHKCPFDASYFVPKDPTEFTAMERVATLDRLKQLDEQIVERTRAKADAFEQEIGKINEAARRGCSHVWDDHTSAVTNNGGSDMLTHTHVECAICGEDWYERREEVPTHGSRAEEVPTGSERIPRKR